MERIFRSLVCYLLVFFTPVMRVRCGEHYSEQQYGPIVRLKNTICLSFQLKNIIYGLKNKLCVILRCKCAYAAGNSRWRTKYTGQNTLGCHILKILTHKNRMSRISLLFPHSRSVRARRGQNIEDQECWSSLFFHLVKIHVRCENTQRSCVFSQRTWIFTTKYVWP